MENNVLENELKHIREDLDKIKEVQESVLTIFKKQTELEQIVLHQVKRADEGRKILHKRIDSQVKQIEKLEGIVSRVVWSLITGLGGLLLTIFMKRIGI